MKIKINFRVRLRRAYLFSSHLSLSHCLKLFLLFFFILFVYSQSISFWLYVYVDVYAHLVYMLSVCDCAIKTDRETQNRDFFSSHSNCNRRRGERMSTRSIGMTLKVIMGSREPQITKPFLSSYT